MQRLHKPTLHQNLKVAVEARNLNNTDLPYSVVKQTQSYNMTVTYVACKFMLFRGYVKVRVYNVTLNMFKLDISSFEYKIN